MFECIVRNEKNTDIHLTHNINTKEGVAEIVQIYAVHIQSLPSNQIMHVHVSAGVDIPFEQMFQIYVGVRKVHTTYKNVDEVNVYLVDSLTVRCFRCLLNLISPTVRIIIHTVTD